MPLFMQKNSLTHVLPFIVGYPIEEIHWERGNSFAFVLFYNSLNGISFTWIGTSCVPSFYLFDVRTRSNHFDDKRSGRILQCFIQFIQSSAFNQSINNWFEYSKRHLLSNNKKNKLHFHGTSKLFSLRNLCTSCSPFYLFVNHSITTSNLFKRSTLKIEKREQIWYENVLDVTFTYFYSISHASVKYDDSDRKCYNK